jgi:hypothetical protein
MKVAWRCAEFPYFAYGEVEEMKGKGKVAIRGHGGLTIRPVCVLTEEEAQQVHQASKALRRERTEILGEFERRAEQLRWLYGIEG